MMGEDMSKVLAINPASQEAVERQELEATRESFTAFLKDDPEVRLMMLERAKAVIEKMSAFDICYHSGFKEIANEILRSDAVRPLLEAAFKREILMEGTDKSITWRLHEAIGNALAEKINMTVS